MILLSCLPTLTTPCSDGCFKGWPWAHVLFRICLSLPSHSKLICSLNKNSETSTHTKPLDCSKGNLPSKYWIQNFRSYCSSVSKRECQAWVCDSELGNLTTWCWFSLLVLLVFWYSSEVPCSSLPSPLSLGGVFSNCSPGKGFVIQYFRAEPWLLVAVPC